MARYTGPKCRVCRREGTQLFLKGDRCHSDKCALQQRNYPPGQHGPTRRGRVSDYGTQLREKQKVRATYGVLERQFRRYFQLADRMKGITGDNLLSLLERRLDNVVFRMGFAINRDEARQLVRHNHFRVNGRKVNIPSAFVRSGDVVEVKEKSRKVVRITDALAAAKRRGVPGWLEVDEAALKGSVKALPSRYDIDMEINERLIVELYSK